LRKLNLKPVDRMLLRMLNRNWITNGDAAKILRCQPSKAFARVREIAHKRRLYAMCIDTGEEQKLIVVKASAEATIVKFVSILPP